MMFEGRAAISYDDGYDDEVVYLELALDQKCLMLDNAPTRARGATWMEHVVATLRS